MDCRDYSKPVSEPRAVATGSCHALLIKTVIGFLLRYHYDPVATARGSDAMRIWIDLANSPHVPFFRALIPEFVARRHQVEITARDFAQTVELALNAGMTPHVIGGHGGASITGKAGNLIGRASGLRKWGRDRGFDLAVSHNSYAHIAAAAALGIKSVTLMDYEHQPANHLAFRLASRVIVPRAFPSAELKKYGASTRKVKRYEGTKEDVYLGGFVPDPAF